MADDRKRKLEELAKKRSKDVAANPAKKPAGSGEKSASVGKKVVSERDVNKREDELERKLERELEGRPDEYEKDGFVVDEDDEEGEEEEEEEEEEEDIGRSKKKKSSSSKHSKKRSKHDDDDDEDDDDDDVPKKRSRDSDKKKGKKRRDADDDDGDDDDDMMEGLDTSVILTTSRRSTRGAKIDYTKFGPDKSDDERDA